MLQKAQPVPRAFLITISRFAPMFSILSETSFGAGYACPKALTQLLDARLRPSRHASLFGLDCPKPARITCEFGAADSSGSRLKSEACLDALETATNNRSQLLREQYDHQKHSESSLANLQIRSLEKFKNGSPHQKMLTYTCLAFSST
jgi:hypothetical protein